MTSAFAASVAHAQVAAPAGTAPAPADAANVAASAPAQSGGEIIVTAQKRSERLQDVPMSITAATGAQLRQQGITTVAQLEKITPGFTINRNLYGSPVFYIRGIGFNDTALGVSPAVSVYTDQLPLPFSPMTRGVVLDLERVEVLKGPQGTLFGENSTGGAINFIAAKPTRDVHAGVDLTYGRFNQVDAEAFVSGPVTDTVAVRLAVRNEYRGDWQKGYTTNETLGQKDFQNARFTVDWRPTSRLKVEIMATGWRDRSDAQQPQFVRFAPLATGPRARVLPYPIATFPSAPNDDRAAAWDPARDFRQNNWYYQFGGRLDYEISDNVNLTSLTSYSRYRQHVPTEFDATTYPLSLFTQDGSISSFSQELRLSGDFSANAVKWMVGANYERDRVFEHIVNDPVTLSNSQFGPYQIDDFYTNSLQKVRTGSVFGSLDVKLTNTLTAQGSVRYTRQKRGFAGCLYDSGDGSLANSIGFLIGRPIPPGSCVTVDAAFAPVPIIRNRLNQDNVSWRGGLNWKPSGSTLFYANVTKGFKAGSFPTIPYINVAQADPVGQESVLAYEAGTKTKLFSGLVELDGALFYYDYRHKQLNGYVLIQPFGPTPGLVSIPKATVKGAEVSATFRPMQGLTLTANGTYVHTRIDRNPANPYDFNGNPTDYVGLAFANTPKWQGVLDGLYRFSVSGRLDAYLGSTLTYHSTTYGVLKSGVPSADELERIRRFALLDLRAGVEMKDGRVRLEAFGRNVTDRFYLTGTNRNGDYYTRFTGQPATYGLELVYRY